MSIKIFLPFKSKSAWLWLKINSAVCFSHLSYELLTTRTIYDKWKLVLVVVFFISVLVFNTQILRLRLSSFEFSRRRVRGTTRIKARRFLNCLRFYLSFYIYKEATASEVSLFRSAPDRPYSSRRNEHAMPIFSCMRFQVYN